MNYWIVSLAKAVLIVCLSGVLGGCPALRGLLQGEAGQQVVVQVPDQTRSHIRLETQGRANGDVVLDLNDPPFTIAIGRGDSYILRAIAQNTGGVKEVAIWGTTEKVCEDPVTGNATRYAPGLVNAPLKKDTSSATVGGMASTTRYVSYVVKVDMTCSPTSLRFVSQKMSFWGQAHNFSNLITTGPRLTVTAN